MPASTRDAKASSESKRSTIHSARHTTAALQEVEQQQVEHEANQLRAQAKQCLIKHDFEQAEQLLSQGLKLTPGSYKLYRLRSVAYACLQRYRESLEDAQHVIDAMPNMTDGYYHKGFAMYHMDDYAGAAHCFQQALNLNPGDRVLRQGFWDAMTLLSQHRRDDTSFTGAPIRTKSVAPTLAKLHAEKLATQAAAASAVAAV